MIVIYQRNAAGSVERAATATTTAEAHDRLRTIHAPAVAFDGLLPVGASGHTRTPDLAAITRHATKAAGGERSQEGESCQWPGCHSVAARVILSTPAGLNDFCTHHRRIAYENSRPLSTDSPRQMRALSHAVGPTPCCEHPRGCTACKAAVRAAARELAARFRPEACA